MLQHINDQKEWIHPTCCQQYRRSHSHTYALMETHTSDSTVNKIRFPNSNLSILVKSMKSSTDNRHLSCSGGSSLSESGLDTCFSRSHHHQLSFFFILPRFLLIFIVPPCSLFLFSFSIIVSLTHNLFLFLLLLSVMRCHTFLTFVDATQGKIRKVTILKQWIVHPCWAM